MRPRHRPCGVKCSGDRADAAAQCYYCDILIIQRGRALFRYAEYRNNNKNIIVILYINNARDIWLGGGGGVIFIIISRRVTCARPAMQL